MQEPVAVAHHVHRSEGVHPVSEQNKVQRLRLGNVQIVGCKGQLAQPDAVFFHRHQGSPIVGQVNSGALFPHRYRQVIGDVPAVERQSLGNDIPKA